MAIPPEISFGKYYSQNYPSENSWNFLFLENFDRWISKYRRWSITIFSIDYSDSDYIFPYRPGLFYTEKLLLIAILHRAALDYLRIEWKFVKFLIMIVDHRTRRTVSEDGHRWNISIVIESSDIATSCCSAYAPSPKKPSTVKYYCNYCFRLHFIAILKNITQKWHRSSAISSNIFDESNIIIPISNNCSTSSSSSKL